MSKHSFEVRVLQHLLAHGSSLLPAQSFEGLPKCFSRTGESGLDGLLAHAAALSHVSHREAFQVLVLKQLDIIHRQVLHSQGDEHCCFLTTNKAVTSARN